jgi:hypothetical protein
MSSWPKVYDAVEPDGFIKMGNGNVFFNQLMNNMANNVNHIGPVVNGIGSVWTQYNRTTGITTWAEPSGAYNKFVLNSGDIQFYDNSTQTSIYRNGASGSIVAGPSYVASNVEILAEDNGKFIARKYNAWNDQYLDFCVPGNNPVSYPIAIPAGYYIWGITKVVCNPNSHKLFLQFKFHAFIGVNQWKDCLAVYDIGSNSLTMLNPPYGSDIPSDVIHINSADKAFLYDNSGTIMQYDYVNGFSYPTISNLPGVPLVSPWNFKQTVEDKFMAISASENKIYVVNTTSLSAKYINATLNNSLNDPYIGSYYIDGDDIFISGGFTGNSCTIGPHTMPLLGSVSGFITKLSISGQFTRSMSAGSGMNTVNKQAIHPLRSNETLAALTDPGIEVMLSPNPARNNLQVNIRQAGKGASWFLVSIINSQGIVMQTKKLFQNVFTLDLSRLIAGIYKMVITTDKGTVINRDLIKE